MASHDNDWQGWNDGDWKQRYDNGCKTAGDLVAPDGCAEEANDDVAKDKSTVLTKGKRAKKTANRRPLAPIAEEPQVVNRQTLDTQTSSSSACGTADVVPEAPGILDDINDMHDGKKEWSDKAECVKAFLRLCRQPPEPTRRDKQLKGTKISVEVGQRRTLACKFVDTPVSPRTSTSRQVIVRDAYATYEEEQLRQLAIDIIIDTRLFLNS